MVKCIKRLWECIRNHVLTRKRWCKHMKKVYPKSCVPCFILIMYPTQEFLDLWKLALSEDCQAYKELIAWPGIYNELMGIVCHADDSIKNRVAMPFLCRMSSEPPTCQYSRELDPELFQEFIDYWNCDLKIKEEIVCGLVEKFPELHEDVLRQQLPILEQALCKHVDDSVSRACYCISVISQLAQLTFVEPTDAVDILQCCFHIIYESKVMEKLDEELIIQECVFRCFSPISKDILPDAQLVVYAMTV